VTFSYVNGEESFTAYWIEIDITKMKGQKARKKICGTAGTENN